MALEDLMQFVDTGLDEALDSFFPEVGHRERSENMRRLLEVWRSQDYKEELKACSRGLVSPADYPQDAARFQQLMHGEDLHEFIHCLPHPTLQPLWLPLLLNPDNTDLQGQLMGFAIKLLLMRKHMEKFGSGTQEGSEEDESDLGSDFASKD